VLGRITRTVSDVTVGTVIVLFHVALHAREERDRVLAGRQLADETGDRDGLVPHHHVPRTRHGHVTHVA
jgi:hypothetical protein